MPYSKYSLITDYSSQPEKFDLITLISDVDAKSRLFGIKKIQDAFTLYTLADDQDKIEMGKALYSFKKR